MHCFDNSMMLYHLMVTLSWSSKYSENGVNTLCNVYIAEAMKNEKIFCSLCVHFSHLIHCRCYIYMNTEPYIQCNRELGRERASNRGCSIIMVLGLFNAFTALCECIRSNIGNAWKKVSRYNEQTTQRNNSCYILSSGLMRLPHSKPLFICAWSRSVFFLLSVTCLRGVFFFIVVAVMCFIKVTLAHFYIYCWIILTFYLLKITFTIRICRWMVCCFDDVNATTLFDGIFFSWKFSWQKIIC